MPWAAAGAIGGALIGSSASKSAANTQAKASEKAAKLQKEMFDITRQDQAPYRESGYRALGNINTLMNLDPSNPGSFMHRFGAEDLNENLAPNWKFGLEQGQGAIQNMSAKSGGLLSGNSLRGIADYTVNRSGDLYQNAFQNYTANQTNIFNRLSSIAGLGQTANQATGVAATAAGQGIGNSIQNMGAARAAGQVGSANAISGGLNNAASWYMLKDMMG